MGTQQYNRDCNDVISLIPSIGSTPKQRCFEEIDFPLAGPAGKGNTDQTPEQTVLQTQMMYDEHWITQPPLK